MLKVSCLCFQILLTAFCYAQAPQFSRLNTSDGLSHNQVTSIIKDHKGFMWFGTMSGLNRYDGYSFRVFRHDKSDSSSLEDDNIISLKRGPEDKLWVETRLGYTIYNPDRENFQRDVSLYLRQRGMAGDVVDIAAAPGGAFWFATSGGLYFLGPHMHKAVLKVAVTNGTLSAIGMSSEGLVWLVKDNGVILRYKPGPSATLSRITGSRGRGRYRLFVDRQSGCWVYALDRPEGVRRFSADGRLKNWFRQGAGRSALNSDNIYGLSQDAEGRIWIATDHGGINIFDQRIGGMTYLLNKETDAKTISQNSATAIYSDDLSIVWIGTYKKGINVYQKGSLRFPLYRHEVSNPASLPYDDVNRFAEDSTGNLWIGTNGGGLIFFDRKQQSFRTYRHDPSDPDALSNDVIVSLHMDKKGLLWIGTYFGGLDCFDGKRFRHYRHRPGDGGSISDDRIWELMEDAAGRLWIGTLAGGVNVMEMDRTTIRRLPFGAREGIRSGYVSALLEDSRGNIWIGGESGIDVWQKGGGFKHYSQSDKQAALSNDFVIAITEDHKGRVWIGTQDGLNIYQDQLDGFRKLDTNDGLSDNTILNIVEDVSGDIWLSTPRGISSLHEINSAKFQVRNYDESDGLQGTQFNENAALVTSKGELVFGGSQGFNIFMPQHLRSNGHYPALVLTDFQLFNRSILPGQPPYEELLQSSISETEEIKLRYDQNVFSIQFAALNYMSLSRVRYRYMLEGFNSGWLLAEEGERRATFTNLDPGRYVFKVQASDGNGHWPDKVLSLRIHISPPLWQTPLAIAIYIALACFLLVYLRQRGIARLKKKFALQQERQHAQRVHELDMMKIKFFTNVSHEFRTPISLILAPLERLMAENADQQLRQHLQMMGRNARRLLNLVNQLLDFRKLEVQELKLQPSRADIIPLICESYESFADYAQQKNIRFIYRSSLDTLMMEFDQDKIERVLFNLLSNAFKFTPAGGEITVSVSAAELAGEHMLRIAVIDTGIGIAPEKQEKIFEPFFQNELPGSLINQGSGIGLSITKEFVSMHCGRIELVSRPNEGSSFTVILPLKGAEAKGGALLRREINGAKAEPDASPQAEAAAQKKGKTQRLLLVEDNDDFRFYLKDNLRQHFEIIEAVNGREGWALTLSAHPDLVVSDINMPEMDGLELCRKLKGDKRTEHVPVILLTAFSGEEQLLRGLDTGANDYMTKPFSFEVLLSRIRSQIRQKDTLKRSYQRKVEADPQHPELQSQDDKFISRAMLTIEKNISRGDFSVEELSSELGMSRVALYKKIMTLTGLSPLEFIRSIRLKRAAYLLEHSQLNVSEVAWEVGFNNPKVFARYFKESFGVLPSAWLRKHEKRD